MEDYIKDVIQSEGLELEPYTDSKGNITGGVGHLFTKDDYSEFDPDWDQDQKMAFWMDKFDKDWAKALAQATKDSQDFEVPLSSKGLLAMAELNFNMGDKGFGPDTWPKFFKAMSQGDREEAARQLELNSKGGPSQWSKDVGPHRTKRIVETVRNS